MNLPIYFFAGKSFREISLDLIRRFLSPFFIRVEPESNTGGVMLAQLKNKTSLNYFCQAQLQLAILAEIELR
jgi:hypothetical protein